jgi:hypothetical protein
MTLHFYTFCVDISRVSKEELQRCLIILAKSIATNISNHRIICYTNFKIETEKIKDFNIEIRKYYDKSAKTLYKDSWLNLSFNKINIYKDLYDEFGIDFIWVDLDTIISSDISYINDLSNCFIENGGIPEKPNKLFINNDKITVPRNKYIQGNLWKLNIDLYNQLFLTLNTINKKGLKLRFDLQDLFSYYIYIENKGDLKDIFILGNNFQQNTINGLSIWDKKGTAHANLAGLNNLYYENTILRSKFYENKEIHIVSFTFPTLQKIWDKPKFKELFPSE